jgi:hypothetical protein
MLIIAEKIRKYAKENKMTQNGFAKLIDYNHGAFTNMLNGKDAFFS